jgi:hypothetical protein
MKTLLTCLTTCETHHLQKLASLCILELAGVFQDLSGFAEKSILLLQSVFPYILQNGTPAEKGKLFFLHGSFYSNNSKSSVISTQKRIADCRLAIKYFLRSLEQYKIICDLSKTLQIYYILANIYNCLQENTNREKMAAHCNNCIQEIQCASNSMFTYVTNSVPNWIKEEFKICLGKHTSNSRVDSPVENERIINIDTVKSTTNASPLTGELDATQQQQQQQQQHQQYHHQARQTVQNFELPTTSSRTPSPHYSTANSNSSEDEPNMSIDSGDGDDDDDESNMSIDSEYSNFSDC